MTLYSFAVVTIVPMLFLPSASSTFHGYPLLGIQNGSYNFVVPGAPAEIAGTPMSNLGFTGAGVLIEQSLSGHDEPWRTNSALQRSILQEGLLERMQTFRPS